MPEISIDIKVCCDECGADLDSKIVAEAAQSRTVAVVPCEKCLETARDEGYDEGHGDGYDEGLDKGYRDGTKDGHKEALAGR